MLDQPIERLQTSRDKLIRFLDEANNSTEAAREVAENLFATGLTVYSKDYCINSLIYNSFSQSILDSQISLHPDQLTIINEIINNKALVVSAPTSFGKTFCVFEYIARYRPHIVVMVVPTLALIDEYMKKIIRKYRNGFLGYRVFTNLLDDKEYDFKKDSLFILTHDRVLASDSLKIFKQIDFLVVDEVYKLETDETDDRVLVLNMAYYFLSKKAEKYVLLAPFIKEIVNLEKLAYEPRFFHTNYSPVVNQVETIELLREKDRPLECRRLLENECKNQKTLVYFPTVVAMYSFIEDVVSTYSQIAEIPENVQFFLQWARTEIHEEWCVIKAIERGFVLHNGQIPLGTRMLQIDLFEGEDSSYNTLLCTSTLLEGINTTAKNLIIFKPSRKPNRVKENFTAFDFFNLVGRTGRLYQHFVGIAYYLKTASNPDYKIEDAARSIKFEIVDETKDIDIQMGTIDFHNDVKTLFEKIPCTEDEYKQFVGSKIRFDSCVALFESFTIHKAELAKQLSILFNESEVGRYQLVKILYQICEGNNLNVYNLTFMSNIICKLIDRRRLRIKTVVQDMMEFFKDRNINDIIGEVIKAKMSTIEHQFYTKCTIILFFMEKSQFKDIQIRIFEHTILNAIESVYFSKSPIKKMLLDLGIYDQEVDLVAKVVGEDITDLVDLKARLNANKQRIFPRIGYMSKYIIENL